MHNRPAGSGKKASKFSLGGGDEDSDGGGEALGLTHMGKSLADLDDLNDEPNPDDVDPDIMEEVMKDYNFGGGDDEGGDARGPD
eukprot:356275-Chlamydomonas_euryale.AAC.1